MVQTHDLWDKSDAPGFRCVNDSAENFFFQSELDCSELDPYQKNHRQKNRKPPGPRPEGFNDRFFV